MRLSIAHKCAATQYEGSQQSRACQPQSLRPQHRTEFHGLTRWWREQRENNGAFGSEQMADAYFINESVAHVCHPEPDAKSDYGIVAEFQIASGINLMRLPVRGQ